MPAKVIDHASHFWSKVDKSGECWIWLPAPNKTDPAGAFWDGKHQRRPPRYSYEMAYGPIPEGMFVCHHCDNPRCVRPDHLFVGTHSDNMADCKAKGRNLFGSKHNMAKLREDQVIEIRRRFASGGISSAQLGREYGVCPTTINAIVAGRIWQCVPMLAQAEAA